MISKVFLQEKEDKEEEEEEFLLVWGLISSFLGSIIIEHLGKNWDWSLQGAEKGSLP